MYLCIFQDNRWADFQKNLNHQPLDKKKNKTNKCLLLWRISDLRLGIIFFFYRHWSPSLRLINRKRRKREVFGNDPSTRRQSVHVWMSTWRCHFSQQTYCLEPSNCRMGFMTIYIETSRSLIGMSIIPGGCANKNAPCSLKKFQICNSIAASIRWYHFKNKFQHL